MSVLHNFSMGENQDNHNKSLILSTWLTEVHDCSLPSKPIPTMKHYLIITAYCFFYAIAAAMFYKKSFNAKVIPAVLLCLLEGFCLQHYDVLFGETCGLLITLPLLGFIILYVSRNPSLASSYDLASYFVFFLTIFDANMGILENIIHSPYIARALLIAIPQFIRIPLLRELRSKLGPMFVFYTVLTQRELLANHPEDSVSDLSSFLAGVAAVSAVLAGIVSRPDNSTIMEYFWPGTELSDRRRYHGRLMATSLFITCLIAFRYYMMSICVFFIGLHFITKLHKIVRG